MRMYGPLKKQRLAASLTGPPPFKKMTVRVELHPKQPSSPPLKKLKTEYCFASIPAPSTTPSRESITSAVFHVALSKPPFASVQVAPSTPASRDHLRVALSKAHDIPTIKKQTELKRGREQARLKLMEVDKRAVIEDKLESFKELEMICGCQVGIGGFPLDWLGLTRKDVEEEVDSI